MSKQRVAVAGAGNLGVPIIKALLDASFQVTVLTRSTPADASAKLQKGGFPTNNPDLSFATVDYASISSLTSALTGHFAVVSTLGTSTVGEQAPLITASVAAGVTRFIPSEFGSNTQDPAASQLAVYGAKIATHKLVAKEASEHPGFSYTVLMNGPFFDWCLKMGVFADLKGRKATIYDGGDNRISTTTLATIGRTVAAILSPSNIEKTKNRVIYVHEAVITINQLIDIVNKNSSSTKADWDLTEAKIADLKANAVATIAKGDPSTMGGAMFDLIKVAVNGGEAYGSDFSKFGTDNELLGIPMMGEKEVEQTVVAAM